MFVTITCRACGLRFKVQARHVGKLGSCPKPECGRKFLVPATEEDATEDARETRPPLSRKPSGNVVPAAPPVSTGPRLEARPPAPPAERPAPSKPAPPSRPQAPSEKSAAPRSPEPENDVDWLYQHAGVERESAPAPPGRLTVSSGAKRSASPASREQRSTAIEPPPSRLSTFARRSPKRFAAIIVAISLAGVALIGLAASALGKRPIGFADAGTTAQETPEQRVQRVTEENAAVFSSHVAPYLKSYCADCHAGDQAEAGLILDQFATEDVARRDRKTWEKVALMVEADAMPPADHPSRPKPSETKLLIAWLDARVFQADCELPPDPGRVTVRRLNRNEYNNTVRDLVGVNIRPADDFPSDDVGYGFDNIGDVLSLPPLLMEKYLDAAEKVATAAIVVHDPKGTEQIAHADRLERDEQFQVTDDDFVGLFSAGQVSFEFDFPAAGEYVLKVEAKADQAGSEQAKVELRVSGRAVKTFEVQGQRRPAVFETKLRADKGKQRVAAVFPNDFWNPNAKNPRDKDRNLYVKWIAVQGPIGAAPTTLPESHTRIVTVRPDGTTSLRDAAKTVLRPFARRAFRRPVTDEEIEPFVKLAELAAKNGEQYERCIQIAVQGILCSPHFLFRIEQDSAPNDPKAKHAVNDYELATRLSYFLWSSMPDEELFQAADRNELHKPEVLERQARRMLADAKSRALIENFGGQWLNLRNLDELTPDPNLFPEFNAELRADMKKETELFFESIVREDRSILDLIDGRYTFLNGRLAKHYGLPAPAGDAKSNGGFQKVSLSDDRRGGVLTQASILTLTSDPNKTSPVKRGKWILENILGTPPPPPPPNVPELEAVKKANPNASLREQLALHRTNATCASCHKQMDPLGFGFENFDPLGRWRDRDGQHLIDPSGTLPNGETFRSPAELRTILKGRQKQFTKHFTKQLLTFALGRGLEDADQCPVDAMAESVAKGNHRFSALVMEVVKSNTFLMRRGEQ